MPARPLRPCTTPGHNVVTGTGRCQQCLDRLRADRRRRSPQHDYGPLWRVRRAAFLADNPRCALCNRRANVADHHPVSRRLLIARGVVDPDTDDRLRPLCKPCHDRETAQLQPGGWHRDR